MTDATVWLSIGQGLVFAAVCLLFGIWVARFVGLLSLRRAGRRDARRRAGVGSAGARVMVGRGRLGRTQFVHAGGRRLRDRDRAGGGSRRGDRPRIAEAMTSAPARRHRRRRDTGTREPRTSPRGRPRRGVFIVAVALLYGSTLVLSPRDGVQPVEFADEAYYSVLGSDLARTGTETVYSPSGFSEIPGLPAQTWYHWGEMWLGRPLSRSSARRHWTPATSSSCPSCCWRRRADGHARPSA